MENRNCYPILLTSWILNSTSWLHQNRVGLLNVKNLYLGINCFYISFSHFAIVCHHFQLSQFLGRFFPFLKNFPPLRFIDLSIENVS